MNSASDTPIVFHAALLCTCCDIPAAQKVSGFVGYSAYHTCSRCLKPFPTAAFGKKNLTIVDFAEVCGYHAPQNLHATCYKCAKTQRTKRN